MPRVPGRTLFRILTMPPWIVPMAIGIFMWGWMYNGQFGMISGLLQHFGIISGPVAFLAYGKTAFWATIVTDVWIGVPLVTIYMLAAMQSIPRDLYEAAWIDGAGRFYRFRRITLPLIVPAIVTMSMLSLIATFNSFDIIWILTRGGPSGETTTMIIDTYKTAIGSNKYGEGAARAVLICIFLSVFCFAYFRVGSAALSRSGDTPVKQPPSPMIDRYTWYETGRHLCSASPLFLFFVLAPFVEGFLVSLKPLVAAVFLALPLHAGERLLRRLPHDVGPACRASGVTSSTASSSRPSRPLIVLVLVGPGGLCVRALRAFPAPGRCSAAFLAVNMFSGAVLIIPLFRLMRIARAAQHLFRDDRAGRRLPDPVGHLAAAHLHDAHSARAATRRPGSTAPAISTRCAASSCRSPCRASWWSRSPPSSAPMRSSSSSR